MSISYAELSKIFRLSFSTISRHIGPDENGRMPRNPDVRIAEERARAAFDMNPLIFARLLRGEDELLTLGEVCDLLGGMSKANFLTWVGYPPIKSNLRRPQYSKLEIIRREVDRTGRLPKCLTN